MCLSVIPRPPPSFLVTITLKLLWLMAVRPPCCASSASLLVVCLLLWETVTPTRWWWRTLSLRLFAENAINWADNKKHKRDAQSQELTQTYSETRAFPFVLSSPLLCTALTSITKPGQQSMPCGLTLRSWLLFDGGSLLLNVLCYSAYLVKVLFQTEVYGPQFYYEHHDEGVIDTKHWH